jgi:hypothetical protein
MGIDAKDRIEYEYKIFENVLERGATEEEIIEELKQNPQYYEILKREADDHAEQ